MEWSRLAAQQAGLIAHAQLIESGVTQRQIDRLLRRGDVVRHDWGIYLVRGAPMPYEAELWLAVLATGGALGFATAAHLWGLADRPEVIDVIIDVPRRVKPRPQIRLHRVFTPLSAVTEIRGLPITTRAWTLLDHLGGLPPRDAQRLADRALQRGWLARSDFARRLRDYPQRAGNVRLRELFDTSADGAAAVSERMLHQLLRRAAITGWTANHRVWVGGELVAIVDVAFASYKLALEVDGWAYHSDVERFQRDRQRGNRLGHLGWTVLRFTWADVAYDGQRVVAEVRQALGQVMER